MITLDAILAAISAPDPFTQMDRVVREEMAAGRKVKDIFADINPLVNTVLGTPGLPEDGEEAFLGTLDALTGNCHRDCCYFDPPTLPTEEEIAELPRWARVAFAARCARRVLPLVRWGWSSAPNRAIVDAVTIVQFIERNAADATPRIEAAEAAAHRVANLAIAARDAVPPAYVAAQAAAVIRAAAASALDLAASAGHAARSAAAVGATVCAFADAANTTIPSITQIQAIHRDFTRLTQRAQYENWDDNTPVPPEFFGPLWPEGAPPGWPTDLDPPRHTELELEIVASERVIDRIMEDEVVNLFNAINRYHIARGGSPLTLDELLPYLNPSLVPVGA